RVHADLATAVEDEVGRGVVGTGTITALRQRDAAQDRSGRAPGSRRAVAVGELESGLVAGAAGDEELRADIVDGLRGARQPGGSLADAAEVLVRAERDDDADVRLRRAGGNRHGD